MDVEDDLRSGRRPLQVTSNPNPQLVYVCVFTIIRRDRQRVRDGQQLGEERAKYFNYINYCMLNAILLSTIKKQGVVPSVERRVLGPASRARRLQEAACPQIA